MREEGLSGVGWPVWWDRVLGEVEGGGLVRGRVRGLGGGGGGGGGGGTRL